MRPGHLMRTIGLSASPPPTLPMVPACANTLPGIHRPATPPPIARSNSHTQAFHQTCCCHRSDNLKGHIHTYFRGQLMHLFSLASHQSARCIPTYSSSCVCQVSHQSARSYQSARCIPTAPLTCYPVPARYLTSRPVIFVSHQSARWLHQLPRCLHHPVFYNLCSLRL